MDCPRCGNQCMRDEVHNGVAMLYGPWGCECGWSEDSRYDQATASQPATGHIDQWGGLTPEVREERDANAKLIAAAPDLLAACEECLKVIDECYEATGCIKVCRTSEQRLKIEAAIAKAKGTMPCA
jgi:hypothetical protein